MSDTSFLVEEQTPFAQSLIWQLNRDYYQSTGIDAWSSGVVPYHLTSSAMVGKTYAELVFALLKDIAAQGNTEQTVYILELGAGHGKLAFHVLRYLERLCSQKNLKLPPYKYVLSDISEDSLQFFINHPQFQTYFKSGVLDVAYFDAIGSDSLALKIANQTINRGELKQPLIAFANYFFDSIPNDLFYFQGNQIAAVEVSLSSPVDPKEKGAAAVLEEVVGKYHLNNNSRKFYDNEVYNEILESYRGHFQQTFLMFPDKGMSCLSNLKELSANGLIVLSMDKGYHDMQDLDKQAAPDMVTHGSMSFWVNFHAMGKYCEHEGGTATFPSFPNHHLELAAFKLLDPAIELPEFETAYRRFVDDYGPDDFNGLMKLSYKQMTKMDLLEMMAMIRLSAYDATYFSKVLPRIKQLYRQVSFRERARLAETMHQVWKTYFWVEDKEDLAFELGGMFYALGFYQEALDYFNRSIQRFGHTADEYYNRALCHYQLRQDTLFYEVRKEAKAAYPTYEQLLHLDELDMNT